MLKHKYIKERNGTAGKKYLHKFSDAVPQGEVNVRAKIRNRL